MKLNEVIMPLLLRHDLKHNRGKLVRKLVKGASKKANPIYKGGVYNPRSEIVPGPEDQGQFSGLF